MIRNKYNITKIIIAEHKLTLDEPNGEVDSNLESSGNFVGPSHPPPYSSLSTHLAHTPPVSIVLNDITM